LGRLAPRQKCPEGSQATTSPSFLFSKAENAELFEAGRDAVWIRGLLCEVEHCPGKEPTLIYHENQDSISWTEGGQRKVNHIELKYLFTQHLIQSGQVKARYLPSEDNVAGCLTKALAGALFKKMRQGLRVA
jgi:hypothetical protein